MFGMRSKRIFKSYKKNLIFLLYYFYTPNEILDLKITFGDGVSENAQLYKQLVVTSNCQNLV